MLENSKAKACAEGESGCQKPAGNGLLLSGRQLGRAGTICPGMVSLKTWLPAGRTGKSSPIPIYLCTGRLLSIRDRGACPHEEEKPFPHTARQSCGFGRRPERSNPNRQNELAIPARKGRKAKQAGNFQASAYFPANESLAGRSKTRQSRVVRHKRARNGREKPHLSRG